MNQHVLIRFGRWQDILAQDLPADEVLYCVTTAMLRYARTVALANIRDIAGAEAERETVLRRARPGAGGRALGDPAQGRLGQHPGADHRGGRLGLQLDHGP